ncbi:hypothetical protein JCM8208_005825 [Rhodotorula glutinis]
MHDQALLLSYVSKVYRDLAESAANRSSHANREDVLRVVQSLKSSVDQLVAAWPTFSPPEAEAISDRLLAAACRSAVDGTLKSAEISYRRLVREVCAVPRPEHEQLVHSAYTRIGLLVESICAMYSTAGEHSQVQAADEWRTQVTSVVTHDKLRRWGPRAAVDISQRIEAVEQILERRERAHEALFLPTHVLPSTDVLLHHAHLQTQTAQERRATFHGLLGDLVLLYSENNKSYHASAQHKEHEANTLYEAIQSRTTESADRLYHQLTPEQQQTAVDMTRSSVARSADTLHSTGELPPADLLAQALFDPARPPPHPAVLPSTHSSQHPLQAATLQSLARAHAHADTPRLSDYYARKYYGTTARAWQARLA